MAVFVTKKPKPTINRNNEPLIQRSVLQNNIQKKSEKDTDKNKLIPSPTKLDFSSLTKDEFNSTMAMIQKMKASKLFSKMFESLENSSESYKVKMLGATKFHTDTKAGGGMYDPSTKTIYFSLKGYLPELTMAQEMFHAYQDSPEMEKIVVRTNDIESKNSYLTTDIEAEGEIATFYMALEVYGSAENNPYYPLFGGELNFKTQTHGTVFDMLTSPTSEQLNSPEFHKLYLKFKSLFSKQAGEQKKNKNYSGPTTEENPLAFEKLTREVEADSKNLEGPRLEDGNYYSN